MASQFAIQGAGKLQKKIEEGLFTPEHLATFRKILSASPEVYNGAKNQCIFVRGLGMKEASKAAKMMSDIFTATHTHVDIINVDSDNVSSVNAGITEMASLLQATLRPNPDERRVIIFTGRFLTHADTLMFTKRLMSHNFLCPSCKYSYVLYQLPSYKGAWHDVYSNYVSKGKDINTIPSSLIDKISDSENMSVDDVKSSIKKWLSIDKDTMKVLFTV